MSDASVRYLSWLTGYGTPAQYASPFRNSLIFRALPARSPGAVGGAGRGGGTHVVPLGTRGSSGCAAPPPLPAARCCKAPDDTLRTIGVTGSFAAPCGWGVSRLMASFADSMDGALMRGSV